VALSSVAHKLGMHCVAARGSRGRDPCRLRTKRERGPWAAVDLGPAGRRVLPDHYTLRHGGVGSDEPPLRNWVLEVGARAGWRGGGLRLVGEEAVGCTAQATTVQRGSRCASGCVPGYPVSVRSDIATDTGCVPVRGGQAELKAETFTPRPRAAECRAGRLDSRASWRSDL
jgi:hypothetical protein